MNKILKCKFKLQIFDFSFVFDIFFTLKIEKKARKKPKVELRIKDEVDKCRHEDNISDKFELKVNDNTDEEEESDMDNDGIDYMDAEMIP